MNLLIVLASIVNFFVNRQIFSEPIPSSQFLDKIIFVLWINIWLDIGYLLFGWVLGTLAKGRHKVRWQGYGQAIIIQGLALLILDTSMYLFLS